MLGQARVVTEGIPWSEGPRELRRAVSRAEHCIASCVPVRSKYLSSLHNGILASLQDHWRNRAYLIIDEKSMVGLKELYWIDSRLRTIMSNPETEFGGVNVILCGDFYQLPPIASKPLYDHGQDYVNSPEIACSQYLHSLLTGPLCSIR